ncbi:acyl-CoA thioesterase [Actinomadura chokoriensis]|uniref:Hotdog domain-containing protein n=1 Tax=Actinomadura chokoriensis TaxID=454156 RepID=A0ABV4R8M2_9ACTN
MPESSDRITFRLSYGDCDALGIAYFAMFYPWMERTYSGWLYSLGIHSADLIGRFGVYTVGMRSSCRYIRQCEVFDELTCQAVLDHLGTTSYTVGFDFVREGELVAHGEIIFAVRSPDGTKAPIPDGLLDALRSLPMSTFGS